MGVIVTPHFRDETYCLSEDSSSNSRTSEFILEDASYSMKKHRSTCLSKNENVESRSTVVLTISQHHHHPLVIAVCVNIAVFTNSASPP